MCGPKSRCRKERVMERHDNMIPKLYQLVKQLKSAPSYVADHLIVSFGQVSDAFVTVSLSGMWGIMKNDLETLPSSCAMWKKLPETTLQTTVSAFDQVESIESWRLELEIDEIVNLIKSPPTAQFARNG
ncbi:hypothetical protein RRG08_055420 [Elysia crispata]|uniref:Uncharacterized protein n=1 Tax=Elysia crispata TaxID=231223 RepID=A0AAE1AQN7_9GAST|nr:hypothetical protein RRG08_055420 [Elysia crispata]